MKKDGTMGEIKLSNWHARRVVEHINMLVDICIHNENDRNKWKHVFSLQREVIKVTIL
jgi:hypothetical protein